MPDHSHPPNAPAFISAITQTGEPDSGLIALDATFEAGAFSTVLFAEHSLHCPDTISQAATKRQAEYFAGRWLAARALELYGQAGFTLHADQKRCPLWPAGLVGSISHNQHHVRCIVAKRSRYLAVGTDLQYPLAPEAALKLSRRILNSNERTLLEPLETALAVSLCFSAKESIYKALYPIVQRYFGFAAARLVDLDLAEQRLRFAIDKALATLPGCPQHVDVNYLATDSLICSETLVDA